jgi:hypothetical protein
MRKAEELARALAPAPGHTKRTDCPGCGGTYTFAVSNVRGVLKWQCFRAGCKGTKGQDSNAVIDKNTIREYLSTRASVSQASLVLPPHFTSVMSSDRAVRYLERNHCIEAYSKGLAEIQYDPKQDRVVFLVVEDGDIVDGAGRSLAQATPKWYRYGRSGSAFMCGEGGVGVVVEDCASACAVGVLPEYTGIALLGTGLNQSMPARLSDLNSLVVALDRDASAKSCEMRKSLAFLKPTSVRLLERDLKYLDADEIRKVLT